jgi:hypothetical protein
MPFSEVIYTVFPVFALIGIGLLFANFKKIDIGSIVEVLLYLTIPAFVISSLLKKTIETHEILTIFLAATGVVLGVGLISFIYLSLIKKRELRGFYLPTMFMNSGNMALPLVLLAFGEEGLAYAIIYYVTVGILVYTLGIYIAKGKGGWKEVLKLPLLYSVLVGLYFNMTHSEIPAPILNAIDILGQATIPMMLLSLGFRLKSIKISYLSISLTGSVIRIFGGILIAYFIVSIANISGLAQKVILLSSAMPAAIINFVVAEKYNLQSDLVASIVFLSTILSIFTTPIILAWIVS